MKTDTSTISAISNSKDASNIVPTTPGLRMKNPTVLFSTPVGTVQTFLIRNLNSFKRHSKYNVEDGIEVVLIRKFRAFPEGVHPSVRGAVEYATQLLRA